MISFQFHPRKFASAAAYIAERRPSVTKKELCKLMFFVDQKHLLRYGRPVTGDQYNALEQGPVPSRGLNMLNNHPYFALQQDMKTMWEFGHIVNNISFKRHRRADLSVFSRSDIKILDEVIASMGHLNADELEKISHDEIAWKRATQNGPMDYDWFFDGHPEAEEMRKLVRLEHLNDQ